VKYVATKSFRDPFDNGWIEKGKTFVSHEADVFRRFPERFELARSSGLVGAITRVHHGGTVALVDRPRHKQPVSTTKARDIEAFGHPSSEVVIRGRSTEPEQFTVTLGSGARRAIEDEISFARSQLGPDYECGGWLYGQNRPRSSSDAVTIAVATHAGDSTEHGRSSITFGETATSLMLRTFPPELGHMTPLGDWHTHPTRGGTIPSDGDARGWARSLDEYGFNRYTAILVSPSESLGWMNPIFSAWTVRREGVPSLPVCEPARLVG
jgi:Prokaryotic homologs of the JAB domain